MTLRVTAVPNGLLEWREREVLRLRTMGLSIAETAREIGCSPNTVRKDVGRIHQTLEARNTRQAIAIAVAYGLLRIQVDEPVAV